MLVTFPFLIQSSQDFTSYVGAGVFIFFGIVIVAINFNSQVGARSGLKFVAYGVLLLLFGLWVFVPVVGIVLLIILYYFLIGLCSAFGLVGISDSLTKFGYSLYNKTKRFLI